MLYFYRTKVSCFCLAPRRLPFSNEYFPGPESYLLDQQLLFEENLFFGMNLQNVNSGV